MRDFTPSEMINHILADNVIGKRMTKTRLCTILAAKSGTKVHNNYITRWLKGDISDRFYKILKEVHRELCE